MIHSKDDLKTYLQIDSLRYSKDVSRYNFLRRHILRDEQAWMLHYVRVLRKTEYAINSNSFFKFFWKIRHTRWSNYLRVYVCPNICEQGLRLIHNGGGIYLNASKIGKYFTASSGVIIGKKNDHDSKPVIGDNVNFSVGSKAFGSIVLGNNIVVAPNSVVIKDYPGYCVLSGVPAIVIKKYDTKFC